MRISRTYNVRVKWWVRKWLREEIRNTADEHGLELEIMEDVWRWTPIWRITVWGEPAAVHRWLR